jgi:hypothetical protein
MEMFNEFARSTIDTVINGNIGKLEDEESQMKILSC